MNNTNIVKNLILSPKWVVCRTTEIQMLEQFRVFIYSSNKQLIVHGSGLWFYISRKHESINRQ